MPERRDVGQRFDPFPANSDGHLVYTWVDADGQVWACCAYDHGPLCRLCQRCDDTTLSLLTSVHDGHMEVHADLNGEFRFKLTEQGNARARQLIETPGKAQRFYDDLVTSRLEGEFDAE